MVGDEQPSTEQKEEMPQHKVCLAFAELADVALDDFAVAIITGLTGNASYPTPPVTVAQLGTLRSAFGPPSRSSKARFDIPIHCIALSSCVSDAGSW